MSESKWDCLGLGRGILSTGCHETWMEDGSQPRIDTSDFWSRSRIFFWISLTLRELGRFFVCFFNNLWMDLDEKNQTCLWVSTNGDCWVLAEVYSLLSTIPVLSWLVCQQDYTKTTEGISMKLGWIGWIDLIKRVLPWHRQRYALYWVPFQLWLLSGWRKERKWGGVWRRSGVNRTSNINTGDRFLLPTDSQQWFPLTTTTISPNFNKVITLVPKHTTSPHGGEERHPPGKDFSQ